jgi:hypothetical protein
MAESICPRCGEPQYPHETITNRLVALAGQWPGVGTAMRRAIWPGDLPAACRRCGQELMFSGSGSGPDWTLWCPSKHVACHAEHKPVGAGAQWSPATVDHYREGVAEGVIIRASAWPGFPEAFHENSHAWQPDACHFCERERSGAGYRLAIPQVVRYRLDNKLPCLLITDRGDATSVYGTRPYFTIDPAAVPVRTTPQVLNDLAAALPQMPLSEDQTRVIGDIAARMWWRLPWEHVPALHAEGSALIRPTAVRCAEGHVQQ